MGVDNTLERGEDVGIDDWDEEDDESGGGESEGGESEGGDEGDEIDGP